MGTRTTVVITALAAFCGITGCYEGMEEGREFEPREGQGWFQIGGKMQLLHYEIVEGVAVFEGDVVLGEVDEFTAVQLGEREPERGAVLPGRQWLNAELVYRFDKNLPENYRQAVRDAITELEAKTVVRFVERDEQKDYVTIFKGKDGECWSNSFGRNGGEQKISLGAGCESRETVMHEFGHALGLFHEQSRSDRDEHVTVLWDNIIDGRESQFETFIDMGLKGANVGEYDYASIMHYPGWAFAKQQGLSTIVDKQGTPIPYNTQLSAGDIFTIDTLHIAGPSHCGNGVVDGFEACDYGDGNGSASLYWGGDGLACGWDYQSVCEAGCTNELTRESGELWNCDVHEDCANGKDCWMSTTTGGCECTAVCGNGWVEAGEACDFGEGNGDRTIYFGGDGSACGPDDQAVCNAGCGAELTRENGGLNDCDAGDDCSMGWDCWMGGDGGCACTP